MSSWTWVDAWLLAAIPDPDAGGSLSEVIGVADAVNHAIPTRDELASSLGALLAADLVTALDGRFRVTPAGRAVRAQWDGRLGGWQEAILPALARLPRPEQPLPLTEDEVRAAYAKYSGGP